jgi:serine/threonine protein kinase
MHKNGVIHRDLNPRNVFLSSSGTEKIESPKDMIVKLFDFNVSKMVPNMEKLNKEECFKESGLSFENKSLKIGTPCFRAPELWGMVEHYITEAVDLWGVGCVVYALLVGKDPFNGDDFDLRLNIRLGEFDRCEDYMTLSPRARNMIEGLLTADP